MSYSQDMCSFWQVLVPQVPLLTNSGHEFLSHLGWYKSHRHSSLKHMSSIEAPSAEIFALGGTFGRTYTGGGTYFDSSFLLSIIVDFTTCFRFYPVHL